MSESRTKKTIRNSCVGFLTHALTLVMAFVSRTLFVKILGAQYLGIAGLYTNILSVLALSDLGLYTVMTFSLYKPIAEHDELKIASLVAYYRKLYYYIAAAVLAIGLALVPVLPVLINNSTLGHHEFVRYYLLFLLNSVCSYFAISKSTLIRADQRIYIVQIVSSVCTLLMHIWQIVMLLFTHNYTIYLIVQIVFTLINNFTLTIITTKKYPFLNSKETIQVSAEVKHSIIENLKSTFLYKLGATIMNSTDNILISVLLGTVVVGYYNNYYTIVVMVNALISIIIQSVLASIGNYNASENKEKKFKLFQQIVLVFYMLAGFCGACYLCVFEDFICIWIGNEYKLGAIFVWVFVLKTSIQCTANPLWMFRETSGTFRSTKYVMIIAAFFNIVLSILMGKLWGLSGIVFATALSYLITLWWYEPLQLCRNVFFIKVKYYWRYVGKLILCCVPIIIIGLLLQRWVVSSLYLILMKIGICGVATALIFSIVLWKTEEFSFIQRMLSKFCNRLISML